MATTVTLKGDYFVAQIYSSTTIGTIKTTGLGGSVTHQIQSAYSEFFGVSGTSYDSVTDTTTSNFRCIKTLNVNNWIEEVGIDVMQNDEVVESASVKMDFHAAFSFSAGDYVIAVKRAVISRSGSLSLPEGMTIELKADGGFSIGSVVLNNTRVLPFGLDLSKYFDNYSGTFAEGQVVYDESLKKLKLWNGTAWTNVDGTALS